jgi:hypothetical protein
MSSAQAHNNMTAVDDPPIRANSGRTSPLNDYALERIIYRAPHEAPAPIPWPEGLSPCGTPYDRPADQPLPRADVVVVTWTAAEGQALADVLTPGLPSVSWRPYAHQWNAYEPQLTSRSPARRAGCLGYVAQVKIGNVNVLLLKSELHLATDAISAPIVALWQQIIDEARPTLVITTGTAGGIGAATQLGDVFVVTNAKFNCTKDFKSKPWAQQLFTGAAIHADSHAGSFGVLTAPNAGHLRPVATRPPELTFGAAAGGVETVDYFGFANTTDSYGIVGNYSDARTEEMDDATLPLALAQLPSPPLWCSIRNASDPQVSSDIGDLDAQRHWANQIYKRYGYWTTIGSAIATWAVIANHS